MGISGRPRPHPLLNTQTYRVSFPKVDGMLAVPVDGCQVQATIRENLQIHFMHLHVEDSTMILEEVNGTNPR